MGFKMLTGGGAKPFKLEYQDSIGQQHANEADPNWGPGDGSVDISGVDFQADDICFWWGLDYTPTGGYAGEASPSGFTNSYNYSNNPLWLSLSYKVMVGNETTLQTGDPVGKYYEWYWAVFYRPTIVPSTFTFNNGYGYWTSGNPPSATCTMGNESTGIVVGLAGGISLVSLGMSYSGWDHTMVLSRGRVLEKLYGSVSDSPANGTYDLADGGNYNFIGHGYWFIEK